MAYSEFYPNFELIVRWLHVIAGITWIGHLYFFNFVNVPLQAALPDDAKKLVNKPLLLRALWWFRWGAMITFLAGVFLFSMIYMYTPGAGFGPNAVFSDAGGMTARAAWILIGMTLGFIMWFNVWFIIWPAQKRILSGAVPPEELPAVRKRAGLASRVNTFLSGPMLFGMLAPNHYGANSVVTVIVFSALALGSIWAAIKASYSVGQAV